MAIQSATGAFLLAVFLRRFASSGVIGLTDKLDTAQGLCRGVHPGPVASVCLGNGGSDHKAEAPPLLTLGDARRKKQALFGSREGESS